MKDFRKLETLFFIIAIFLVVLCSALLYFDYPLFPNKYRTGLDPRSKIAILDSTRNNIKRKIESIPYWEKIEKEAAIFENDQLFTDDAASALVKFDDGSELEVGENSLFTIVSKNKTNTIDFSKGRINVNIKQNDATLILKSGDSETTIDTVGTALQVKSDAAGEKAQILVLEGTATTQVDGKAVKLSANELVTLEKSGKISEIIKIPVELTMPKRNAKLFGKAVKAHFEWRFLDKAPDTAKLRFRLASDLYFTNLIVDEVAKGTKHSVKSLSPGEYYWQLTVETDDGASVTSEQRRLSVYNSKAPKLLFPIAGELISIREATEADDQGNATVETELNWLDPAGAESYEVEVSEDSTFSENVIKEISKKSQITVKIPPGQYYWRVKATDPDRPESSFSKSEHFKAAMIQIPRPPSSASPSTGSQLILQKRGEIAKLSWDKVDNARSYVLQISSSEDFTQPLLVKNVTETSFSWQPQQTGQFNWRLKPVDFYSRPTRYSKGFALTLKESAPQLSSPIHRSSLNLPEQFPEVKFSWQTRLYGTKYRLQVAKVADFSELDLDLELDRTDHTWTAPPEGQFYWRVLAFDRESIEPALPEQSFSFEINPIKALAPPQLEDEYHFEIEYDEPAREPADSSWVPWLLDSLLGPQAWAQAASTGSTKIRWPQVKGAKKYQIEISKESSFKSTLISENTNTAGYTWNSTTPGTYFFRIAVFDRHGQKSAYSRPARLVIEHPAIRLISPSEGQSITTDETSRQILLKWQALAGADSYQVQISPNAEFSSARVDKTTSTSRVDFESPKPGQYWWRVRNKKANRWSQSRRFSVTEQLPPPELITPYTNEVLTWEQGPAPKIEMSWSKVAGANRYRLYISQNAELVNPILNRKMNTQSFTFIPNKKGSYYWAVRSIGPDFTKGTSAEVRSFVIDKRIEGKDLSLLTTNQRIFLNNDDQTHISLNWQGHEKLGRYSVVVAEDPAFAKVVLQQDTSDPEIGLPLPTGKDYYWRVFAARKPSPRELASLEPGASTYGAPSPIRSFRTRRHSKWSAKLMLGTMSYSGDQQSPSGTQNVPTGKGKSAAGVALGFSTDWWPDVSSVWGVHAEVFNSSGDIEFSASDTQSTKTAAYSQLRYGLWATYWLPWTKALTARAMAGLSQQSRHFFVDQTISFSIENRSGTYLSQKGQLLWRPRLGQHSLSLSGEVGESIEDFSTMMFSADMQYQYNWKRYSFGLTLKGWWQAVDLNLNFAQVGQTGDSSITNFENSTFLTIGYEY